jgi:hypothetical protein
MLSKSLELITQAKDLQEESAVLAWSARTTATGFVLTELKVGLQFIEMARHSYQQNKHSTGHRQETEAIKAHRSVLKFLSHADPTPEQLTIIDSNLADLEAAINHLNAISVKVCK